ncbi:hypothetical protein GCM10010253_27100 [Streptomyces badius]|uniref:Uncharacterized protein n=1 Tax=Streptomyces badius TaxID=1941 RepID=A0ABQ2T6A3_STRBA|nr:hypothetical protein GCM10010253_27100 [Streptomyces badius]
MSNFSAPLTRQRWYEQTVIIHQPQRAIRSHQQISVLKVSMGHIILMQIVYDLGKVASYFGDGFLVLVVTI